VGELEILTSVTRRLPTWGPARYLGRQLRKLYLRRPREDVRAEVDGSVMRLAPRDYVEGQLLFAPHLYEAEERAWVRAHLAAGDTFVDLGAHAGTYTLLAGQVVGAEGHVVAVEASPRTLERLRANVEANDLAQVLLVGCGVSDQDETLKLSVNVSKNSGASSFLIPVGDEVEVHCRPLLDVLRDAGVSRVDGMKADIEGFEYRVLRRFFEDAPEDLWPGFVLVEQKEWWVEQAGGDAVTLLKEKGYEVALRAGADRTWANFALTRT